MITFIIINVGTAMICFTYGEEEYIADTSGIWLILYSIIIINYVISILAHLIPPIHTNSQDIDI